MRWGMTTCSAMMRRYGLTVLALSAILAGFLATGCQSALHPSVAQRQRSLDEHQSDLKIDRGALFRSVYLVYSGDLDPEPTFQNEGDTFKLNLKRESAGGFAVAIDSEGYLLTASHVVGTFTYVIGFMGGRLQLARAAVVRREGSLDVGREYAVLHVEALLDRPLTITGASDGDVLFAIGRGPTGGDFIILGGRVCGTKPVKEGPLGQLLITDIPMWYGDSGGPAFRGDGALAGINTAFWWGFKNWHIRYERYVFTPEPKLLSDIVAMDKLQRGGPNKSTDSTASIGTVVAGHSSPFRCAPAVVTPPPGQEARRL